MDFITILSIFVLACFVGYFVVWSVTPALHTPLMAVTNAISSVIIVGALIAAGAAAVPGSGADHRSTSQPTANDVMQEDVGAITRDGENSPANADSYSTPTLDQAAGPPGIRPAGTPPAEHFPWGRWLGLLAIALASVNIFGGFAVTQRMLAMYKKKERR